MLDLARTRIESTAEYQVHSSYPVSAEGQAVEHVMEDGVGKVRPSSGSANTIAVGVAYSENMSLTHAVMVEEFYVPATGTLAIELTRTPTAAAELLVKVVSTGEVLVSDVAANDGKFLLATKTVTFHADEAGKLIRFVYRYALTAVEAQALGDDRPVGNSASSILNSVSVIKSGEIFTDQFDTADDWAAAISRASTLVIQGGANGRFQLAGSGGTGCAFEARVIHAPTIDVPFLGLYIAI